MSSLLVTIKHRNTSNFDVAINTVVVPIDHHLSLENTRKKVENAYKNSGLEVIVTEIAA